MKATGIVRRIDDLGRVVIPKELRRVMQLRDGAPLEIFVGEDGSVVFKKFSVLGSIQPAALKVARAVYSSARVHVAVCDRERIICSQGASSKPLEGAEITDELDRVLCSRAPSNLEIPICRGFDVLSAFVVPVIAQSEVVGGFIVPSGGMTENEKEARAVIKAAARLLGELIE